MNDLVETKMTNQQLDLIKSTIAKGATNDEMKLFLYRCEKMGLDPLKPGQIYFVKYGSSPGTIVIGLEGMRSLASKSGKHTGTQRGVIRDDNGKCIGAWCEVSRSDWTMPAREEVSLHEYNTGKAQWAKMPETMVKKVAEAAALRMAFPDALGGIYAHEELDRQAAAPIAVKTKEIQALIDEPREVEPEPDWTLTEADINAPFAVGSSVGDYMIPIGKDIKGLTLAQAGAERVAALLKWCREPGRSVSKLMNDFMTNAELYLGSL